MSKRDPERKKQKHAQESALSIRQLWQEKKQVLLLAAGFAALMGVFYSFWFSDFFTTNILEPVIRANARVASGMLNLMGFNTIASGSDIRSAAAAFSVSIKNGCDALEPVAIYSFAVLLTPVPFRMKFPGLATGIPLLLAINQARIISLYIFGIYSKFLFELMHVQVWQALFIAITLIILIYWIAWAARKQSSPQP